MYIGNFNSTSPGFLIGLVTLLPFAGAEGNLAVAWTLYHEIAFYLLFAILIVSYRVGLATMGLWILLCIAAVLDDGGNGVFVSSINLIFIFGMLASYAYSHSNSSNAIWAVLAIGLSVFVAIWCAQVLLGGRVPAKELFYGASSSMVIWAMAQQEGAGRWAPSRLLVDLGNSSYSLYLTHFLTISVMAKLLRRIPFGGPIIIEFMAVFAVCVAVGWLTYVWVERPLLNLARDRRPKFSKA